MISKFRLGLQAADGGGTTQFGPIHYTDVVGSGRNWTPWVMDANKYDPDALRIALEIEPARMNPSLDFRIGIQAADRAGTAQLGPVQYTPWASQGGGWSETAFDANEFDPDAFRIMIDYRPWPLPQKQLIDLRVGLRMVDNRGADVGNPEYTPWLNDGGGFSDWALDSNAYDPDGFAVRLEVKFK